MLFLHKYSHFTVFHTPSWCNCKRNKFEVLTHSWKSCVTWHSFYRNINNGNGQLYCIKAKYILSGDFLTHELNSNAFTDLFYYLFELYLLFVIQTFLLFSHFLAWFQSWKESRDQPLQNKNILHVSMWICMSLIDREHSRCTAGIKDKKRKPYFYYVKSVLFCISWVHITSI